MAATLESEHTLSLMQIEGLHMLADMLKTNAKTLMAALPDSVKSKMGFVSMEEVDKVLGFDATKKEQWLERLGLDPQIGVSFVLIHVS